MLLIISLIATATGLLCYTVWAYRRRHLYELAERIPGPKGLPLIGNALEIWGKMAPDKLLVHFMEMSQKPEYQELGKIWVGPHLVVFLCNAKDIELVLSSSTLLKKSYEYRYFEPWFGNGLLISSGDTWRAHRKMIAPTFHLNVLKRFMGDFNANSKRVIDRMSAEGGKTFDCHDYMSEIMVETLLETVMGVKQATQGRNCLQYAQSVMELCRILHDRVTRIWLRMDVCFNWTNMAKRFSKHLHIITCLADKVVSIKQDECRKGTTTADQKEQKVDTVKHVEATVEAPQHNDKFSYGQSAGLKDDLDVDDNEIGEKRRLPFLEALIEKANQEDGMTDQEIKDQVNTIMFEGHDTTAAGSSFFLCIMGACPDIQEKVIEEIDAIFGDSDREVTFQDTLELKYLERCIMETLRLFPPVPIIAREMEHDLTLASSPGMTIPRGAVVVVGILKLHRRPDIYPNPEVFNPDHFLPENAASRHYYSFVPFSAGPRSCVGRKYAMLKMKILLANIMRQFRVKPGKPMEEWRLQADIILKRTDGFNIALERRKPGYSNSNFSRSA